MTPFFLTTVVTDLQRSEGEGGREREMSRDPCTNALSKALAKDGTEADTLNLARSIEDSIYQKTHEATSAAAAGADDSQYKNEIRSKVSNIKSNPILRRDILTGTIPPQQVAHLGIEEMATPEKRAENAAIRQESTEDALMVNTIQAHPLLEGVEDIDGGHVRNTGQDGIEYDAPQAA